MPEPQPVPNDLDQNDYDEFQFLEGHARWAGLQWAGRPAVVRQHQQVEGRTISFLRWGGGDPELVLLHGAGQNAHSWDTFNMAIDRCGIAIDLPGHGHSEWRPDQDYSPATNARSVAQVIGRIAPRARAVLGMSLGGLISIRLAQSSPALIRFLVLIDITPAPPLIDANSSATQIGLLSGPRQFDSWESIVDAAHAHMPHRDRDSIIPGVRHNVKRLNDGSWCWRYDRLTSEDNTRPDHERLWDDLCTTPVNVMLVKGGRSSVVTDAALAELRRRLPAARVEVVAHSGHSVQSDAPIELASLVNDFLA
jgi:pimeloyl-ACP methyl ester carboxylesterase